MSGQFCASINFIDKPISVQPKLSFRPRSNTFSSENQTYNSQFSYYATLPTEAICTENLTPWKKLLPCFGRSGLASLLNAIPLLNSNYLSLALDYQPVCGQPYCHSSSVSLRQTLSVVFTPPGFADGKQSWSLIKLFGNSIRSACSLSTYSHVLVDVSANNTDRGRTSSITPLPTFVIPSPIDQEHNHSLLYTDWIQNLKHSYQQYAIYDVNDALRQSDSNKINIANIYSSTIDRSTALADPPLTVSRFLTGFSMQSGGIVTRIRNRLTTPLNVTYLDVIPWYLRIYLHTLRIQSTGSNAFLTAKQMYYQPAKDRLNPHHLELRVELPANSETTISYDFDKSFLKWTEYPPDANHGVYVGPAVISARIPSVSFDLIFDPVPDFGTCSADHGCFVRLHTVPLLIHLPTPDFSMPYNVICLVSTVVSLAFGPIHNLTTKRLSLVQTSKLARPNLFKRLLSIFFRKQSV